MSNADPKDDHELSRLTRSLSVVLSELSHGQDPASTSTATSTSLLSWSEEAKRRIIAHSSFLSSPASANAISQDLSDHLFLAVDRAASLLDTSYKSLTLSKKCLNNLLDLLDARYTDKQCIIRHLLSLSTKYWHKKQSTEILEIAIQRYDISRIIEIDGGLYGKLLEEIDPSSRKSKCSISLLKSLHKGLGVIEQDSEVDQVKRWSDWKKVWFETLIRSLLKGESFRDYLSIYHLQDLFRIDPRGFIDVLKALLQLMIENEKEEAHSSSTRAEPHLDLDVDGLSKNQFLPAILCVLKAGNRIGLILKSSGNISSSSGPSQSAISLASPEFLSLPPINNDKSSKSESSSSSSSSISKKIISIPTSFLLYCSLSSSSEAQLSSLMIAMENPSQKTLPSKPDYEVIKSGILNGLSESDARSRSVMKSLVSSLFERLKIASHSKEREIEKLKKRQKQNSQDPGAELAIDELKDELNECDKFLHWVLEGLILKNLDVNLPWTTLTSSLSLLQVLLSSGIDPTYSNHQPSSDPDSISSKSQFSRSSSIFPNSISLEIISPQLVEILLSCLDSRFWDIRSTSLELLSSFPPPLAGYESKEKVKISLIDKAVALMKGSRESESETAAALLELYRKVYIQGLSWPAPALNGNRDLDFIPSNSLPSYPPASAHLQFTFNLLDLLGSELTIAESGDLLNASKDHPLHGVLISLQRMILTLDTRALKSSSELDQLRKVFEISRQLIGRIWNVARLVLCSRSADGEMILNNITDLENQNETDHELSRVLSALSRSNDPTKDSISSVSLSHTHELILTYSFRGMKESASLLSTLASKFVSIYGTLSGEDLEQLLDLREFKEIGETFNKWMTQIRHRGAITTIYSAYSTLSSVILKSSLEQLKILPDIWLSRFLNEIEDSSLAGRLSTTRQSAGLKYCVLALLSGYDKSKQSDEYLRKMIDRLIAVIVGSISGQEKGNQVEEKSKVSGAIHSMNILKVLLEDHVLGERLVSKSNEVLELLVILSIKGFKSHIWDLRNSSMLLFSTCISRIFPTRSNSKSSVSSRIDFSEFFKQNQKLGSFLKNELEETIRNGFVEQFPTSDLGSYLSAILVILSKVQINNDHHHEEYVNFSNNLEKTFCHLTRACLGSRVWKVREQAALAHRSMIPIPQSLSSAIRLLSEASTTNQNQLHGALLAIQALIDTCPEPTSHSRNDLKQALEDRISDLLEHNQCFATKAAFVSLAMSLGIDSRSKISNYCLRIMTDSDNDENHLDQEPCAPAFLSLCASVVLQDADSSALVWLLQHPSTEVRSQALNFNELLSNTNSAVYQQQVCDFKSDIASRLQEMILDVNEDDGLRSRAAEIMVSSWTSIKARDSFFEASLSKYEDDVLGATLNRLCEIVWNSQCIPLSEAVLPYLACLCHAVIVLQPSSWMRPFSACCRFQSICSGSHQSLPTRASSVSALRALSPVLFSSTYQFEFATTEDRKFIFQARSSLLDLLVDDDPDIRSEAALIVSEQIAVQLIRLPNEDKSKEGVFSNEDILERSAATSGAASGLSSDRAFKWLQKVYSSDHQMRTSWALYVWRMLLPTQSSIDAVMSPQTTALFEQDPPNLFRNRVLDVRRAFASSSLALSILGSDFIQSELERCQLSIMALNKRDLSLQSFEEAQRLRHLALQLSLASKALLRNNLGSNSQASTRGTAPRESTELESKYRVDSSINISDEDSREQAKETGNSSRGSGQDGKRYRIAMISDFFFPNVGGVEGHIFAISQRLLARGHKVIIITHAYSPDRVGIRHLSKGLKVYYVPYQVIARQDTLPNFFSLFPLLRTILLRERIQIVHGHQALSSMAHEGILHSRLLGIKAVFTDHSLFGFADAASILTNKLLKFVLSDIDHVVCVSNTGKENTVLRAALDPSKVSVIPNAVVASQFAPEPSNAAPSRVTIIVLSRLMYRKGVDLLIAAIPRLCARHSDIHFLIGGDGPKRVELEQMREKYMLQDRVELVGAVRHGDVRNHLTQGQIFLNTSLTEAFGTSIVEAACAGLFVVSTSVGGIPEVLPPEMTQLAIPEEDDIVRAVEAALEHVRNGQHDPISYHEVVKDMYSWSDVATRLEIVYEKAMEAEMRSFVERLEKYYKGGVIAGKVFCIIAAVDLLFLYFLEWFLPTSQIDTVPSLQDDPEEKGNESGRNE